MTLATSQSSDSCTSHPHRLPSPSTVGTVSRLYKLCSRPSSSSPCVCPLALPNGADCSVRSPAEASCLSRVHPCPRVPIPASAAHPSRLDASLLPLHHPQHDVLRPPNISQSHLLSHLRGPCPSSRARMFPWVAVTAA